MKQSTFFQLKSRDFWQGALMAAGTAIAVIIQNSLAAGLLTFNWQQIGMAAVAAVVTYLSKNLLTDDVKVANKIIDKTKSES